MGNTMGQRVLLEGSMGHSMGHGSMGQWVMGHGSQMRWVRWVMGHKCDGSDGLWVTNAMGHGSQMLTHGPLWRMCSVILNICRVLF